MCSVSRRLPAFKTRYGNFIIDQPNPHAAALLKKTGFDCHRIKGQNAQKDFRHGTSPQGLVYSALNAAIASMVGHADTGRSNHSPSSKAPPGINNAGAIAIHAYVGQPVRAGRPRLSETLPGTQPGFSYEY